MNTNNTMDTRQMRISSFELVLDVVCIFMRPGCALCDSLAVCLNDDCLIVIKMRNSRSNVLVLTFCKNFVVNSTPN